jgi:hypothetical protein
MPDDKKRPLEELDFGEGLVCDPETGICEIPGAGGQKPGVLPPPVDKATTEKGGC